MNNSTGSSPLKDEAADSNRTGWLAPLLGIYLIAIFLYRAFVPAHEFPSTGLRNLTIGLDLLCLVGLIGMRVQASRQVRPLTFGLNVLFWIALSAGLGLFAIRLNGTPSFWTGHIKYGLLPRSDVSVSPNIKETNTGPNDAKPGANTAAPAASDSPSEVYKAFYAAYKNSDNATMKTLVSRGPFRSLDFADKNKADQRNDQTLKKLLERPPGSSDDTRNENITGETATVECLDMKGNWYIRKFVKEDGKWKLLP